MRRRRQWTATEKAACLKAFAASGRSATAFCRETGVPRATLALWQRAARDAAASRPHPVATFAAVEVVAPRARSLPSSVAAGAPAGLTLALRTPDGLEAALTGLDAGSAVTVLRGVLAPRAPRAPAAAGASA